MKRIHKNIYCVCSCCLYVRTGNGIVISMYQQRFFIIGMYVHNEHMQTVMEKETTI